MALGGFKGTDPAATVASTLKLVQEHKVRFFMPPAGFEALLAPTGPPLPAGDPGGTGASPPGASGLGGEPTPSLHRLPPPSGFMDGRFRTGSLSPSVGKAPAVPLIMSLVMVDCAPVSSASTHGVLPMQDDGRIYDCRPGA